MKVTVSAPANIAFLKYWGARDLSLAIPENASLSMTLEKARATTSLSWHPAQTNGVSDHILLRDAQGTPAPAPPPFAARMVEHLRRMKQAFGRTGHFEITTGNNFPTGAGLASSAAGFAALAFGVAKLWDLPQDPQSLSVLARDSGSGSATRSVLGGYVRWPDPPKESAAGARSIFPAEHWELHDVIALVETGEKSVSSLEGHRRATTSLHFPARQEHLDARREGMERALLERDFSALAPLIEEEAIELHLIAMSSRPPIFYWNPGTLEVIHRVRALRAEGVSAAFTMDAGANVHVICESSSKRDVVSALQGLASVSGIFEDHVGTGPRVEATE